MPQHESCETDALCAPPIPIDPRPTCRPASLCRGSAPAVRSCWDAPQRRGSEPPRAAVTQRSKGTVGIGARQANAWVAQRAEPTVPLVARISRNSGMMFRPLGELNRSRFRSRRPQRRGRKAARVCYRPAKTCCYRSLPLTIANANARRISVVNVRPWNPSLLRRLSPTSSIPAGCAGGLRDTRPEARPRTRRRPR
jgi:hypothetical protein